MGKSKKRSFSRNKNENVAYLTRTDAREAVIEAIKNNKYCVETENLIGLFGFTHEELAEHGLSYEELKILPNIYK